jgi:threonine dehydrogenase-like Zn-dependent dehydrogenase
LRCEGAGRVAIVDAPDPKPVGDQALVRIEASAVCGSERPTFVDGAVDGSSPNTGHEACGVVIEPGASSFAVGDRVGLLAVAGCGACDRCLAGQEVHCRQGWTYTAEPGWHAELTAVASSSLLPLPAGTEPAVGAMISGDTLGVAGRAYRRDPSGPGDCVVIIGLGPVGLGHLAVRTFTGADVYAIEPSEYRRDLAIDLGAAGTVAPGETLNVRPRLIFECSGRPESIAHAIELIDDCGVVHQSGLCHSTVEFDPMTFFSREITYTGDMYYASEDYPTMLELVERGLRLEEICTHEVAAEDAQPAITEFLEARSGKVVLRWA